MELLPTVERYFFPDYGPGVEPASNRNEYQKTFLGSGARLALKADNLPAICDNVGSSIFGKPYRPRRPVTGIALLLKLNSMV
jgi:hypothetical protein